MSLILRIFLALTLLWGGALVFYTGGNIPDPGEFFTLLITPIGLLWLCYFVISQVIKNGLAAKEKPAAGAPKKNKPLTPMELYELEKLKNEQQLQAAEIARLAAGKQKPDAKFDGLKAKKKDIFN